MNRELVYQYYETHKTGLYRFALSLLRCPQQAEDVVQDTFVKLLTGKFSSPGPGKEKAWLYKVARNQCMDLLRRRSREAELPPEATAPAAENWEFLELISPLSKSEQELVSLRFIGGFSHGEIARITGTTVHAAKKRYERAIQKLRTEMEVTL